MPGHAAPPAVGLGGVALDLLIGAVLFVVVCTVTAVLMFILQAVLPGGGSRDVEVGARTPPGGDPDPDPDETDLPAQRPGRSA